MVLATSAWRAERNAKARARLMRRLPDIFPPTPRIAMMPVLVSGAVIVIGVAVAALDAPLYQTG